MIILTNTTDKIQVILGATATTNQLPCFASYRDTTTTTIQAKRNALNSNDISAVDLVDSPAASTQRIVDYLSVFNADTTNATITIRFNDNGTLYDLCTVVLATNEKVEYQEGSGFRVISSTGAIRISDNTGKPTPQSSITFISKLSDQATTSTAFSDVTNLSFSVSADRTYWFRFVIPYTSSSTSLGSRWSIDGPASPRILYYYSDIASGGSSKFYSRGVSTYNSSTLATSSALNGNITIIEGIIQPSVSGTVIVRYSIETGGTGTITQKAGAFVKYLQI
jgi:hypothetical protein